MSDNQSDNSDSRIHKPIDRLSPDEAKYRVLQWLTQCGPSGAPIGIIHKALANDRLQRYAINNALIDLIDDGVIIVINGDYIALPEAQPGYVNMPLEFDPAWKNVLMANTSTGPYEMVDKGVVASARSMRKFHTNLGWFICAYDAIINYRTNGAFRK